MMDLAPLREASRDPRTGRSVSLGLVVADDDGGSHWEVRSGDSDIWVRVELQPEPRRVWCRLAGMAGGRGLALVPKLGWECVVVFPGGDHRADPILLAVLSTGEIDGDASPTNVILTGDNIEINALGSGTVSVNGGNVTVARSGDPVSVTVPALVVHDLTTAIIGYTDPATATGTITSGSAGAGRLKG